MKKFIKKLKYNPHEIAEAIMSDLMTFYEIVEFNIDKLLGKYNCLKKNKILKGQKINQRIIILGNSPSLKEYDLKKLKNENVIMVNRSFRHEDYKIIKPEYHVFVDPKLANGVWPLEYLDEIYEKNPNVKLLLNAKLYNLNHFAKYKNNPNVFWIKDRLISLLFDTFETDLTKNFTNVGNVVGAGLGLAIHLGAKKIYFMGMELNGVIKLLADQDSHFEGKDKDYDNHNSFKWSRDLSSNARGIKLWIRMNDLCVKKQIKLINLSKSKLMDFMPLENFDELF